MEVSRASTGRIFDLLTQPFRILGLNPTATNQQIEQAFSAAQQTQVASTKTLSLAREVLRDPARRLSCELSYPLDCPDEEIEAFYATLSRHAPTDEILQLAARPWPLARANLVAHIASHRPAEAALLYALLESHASIDAYEIFAKLRTARTAAGVPAPSLISINQGLEELLDTHAGAVFTGYDTIQAAAEPVLQCCRRIIGDGDDRKVAALGRILAPYREVIAPEQQIAAAKIGSASAALQQRPNDASLVEQLYEQALVWATLCHPLLIWNASQDRRELELEIPIEQLRAVIASLTDNKDYQAAVKIAEITREPFSAVPTTLDQLAEDARLIAVLTPYKSTKLLLDVIEEHERNPWPLIVALEKHGFGLSSAEPAKRLWEVFLAATKATKSTPSAELPWRLVCDFAKSLEKKPAKTASAATRLIAGLIEYGESASAPPEILNKLKQDLRALPTKPRRRMKLAASAFLATAVLGVSVFYLGSSELRLFWSKLGASTRSATPALGVEKMPPVGTGQHLDLDGVRYCHFQEERLRIIKERARGPEDVRAFNLLAVDYNSRCSDFFYRDTDVETVTAEIAANRERIAAEAEQIMSTWPGHTTSPVFAPASK
jgi:hypothetical protein